MSPGNIDFKIVADRAGEVRAASARLRIKGGMEVSEFLADPDHAAAAETYLRRALEALSDLARHLLAKGYTQAASEYAEVAVKCAEFGVLSREDGALFRRMLGYRNRLVHEYLRVTPEELHRIARDHARDLVKILERLEEAAQRVSSQ